MPGNLADAVVSAASFGYGSVLEDGLRAAPMLVKGLVSLRMALPDALAPGFDHLGE
jgi:hypothetical protein